VRTSIRRSVLQALYERPGAWLSTHDLLTLVDEAESSEVLARILSDMAATGRLAKGAKTQNAKGQACNTWGLSPAWRGRLAVENTWQDHTGQAAAEAPPLPAESREDEAPANVPEMPTAMDHRPLAAGLCDYPALNPPFAWVLADPDQTPETPQPIQSAATDIHFHPLPERCLPELRLPCQQGAPQRVLPFPQEGWYEVSEGVAA
jgi:predicted component of type VI protein secretion system